MRVNTDIVGWARIFGFLMGAGYLWRSALRPNPDEPQNWFDRALRIFGAILLSILGISFVSYGLGLSFASQLKILRQILSGT